MLTKRQKLSAAVLGSALIHAALLLAVGIIMARQLPEAAAPTPAPMRLEVVRSEPLEPTAKPTPDQRVVDNANMKAAEHAPADPKFEGSIDTVAASEGPVTGDKPLPSQEGRQAPIYAFDPRPPAPPADAAPPAPTASSESAPPPPAPVRARPQIDRDVVAPTRVMNELAMLDAQPTPPPTPEEENPYDPSFRSTAPPPPVPVRSAAPKSAYRPLEAQTFSSGNITMRGASSVDAAATPFGRYRKALLESIRAVWTQGVHARSDLASLGSVKVHFAVDRSGHVHAPRILSNSSNEALASITLNAINSAPVPPMPPEVVESMDEAMLQLDVTFECL